MKLPFFTRESTAKTKTAPKTVKKKTSSISTLSIIRERIEKSIPTVKSVIAKTSFVVGGIIGWACYSQLDAKSTLNGAISDGMAYAGITSTSAQIHALEAANMDKARKIIIHEKIQSSLQEIIDLRTGSLNTCISSLNETTNDLLVAQSRINELQKNALIPKSPIVEERNFDSLSRVKSIMKNVENDLKYPEFKLVMKYDKVGKAIIQAKYKWINSPVTFPTGNISKEKLNEWSQEQYFFFLDQERVDIGIK